MNRDDFGIPSIDPGHDEDDDTNEGGRAPVVTTRSEYMARCPREDN